MANWAQFGHFHLGVYSLLWPAVLDINGCVLSYFEGTANLHCYTSCTLTTLHCSKVSFLQCCHMTWKDIIKYLQKCEGCTHFCEILYIYIYIYIYIYRKYQFTFPNINFAINCNNPVRFLCSTQRSDLIIISLSEVTWRNRTNWD